MQPVTGPPEQDAQDAQDRTLLTAHLAGDPHAFGELVQRNRHRMWSVALRTLGDPDEAADAVQDACISAFRAAAGFRGEAKISTWLHRIVVNACLDRLRRQTSRPTVPLPVHPTADPRDQMAERETSLDVQQALAALPVDQRLAIVLVDLQGFSIGDAAAVLGVPGGTVKSRCFRGRARLAVSLAFLRERSLSLSQDPLDPSSPPTGNPLATDSVPPVASQPGPAPEGEST